MQFGLWFWKDQYDIGVNGQPYTTIKSSGEDLLVNLSLQHEVVDNLAITAGVRMIADNNISDPSLMVGAKYSF